MASSSLLFVIVVVFVNNCLADVQEPVIVKKTDKALTVEQLDGYLNLLSMFKEMLPKDIMGTIQNLTSGEKGEVVTLLTDIFTGSVKRPENRDELVEFLKNRLPTVYGKIDALNTTFYEKFDKLQPKTQTILREWRDKAVALKSDTAGESAAQQLQMLREFGIAMQNLDAETKEDLRKQFPSAVKLTEGLGFTVFTSLALILQKVIESMAAQMSPTKAPLLDCPI